MRNGSGSRPDGVIRTDFCRSRLEARVKRERYRDEHTRESQKECRGREKDSERGRERISPGLAVALAKGHLLVTETNRTGYVLGGRGGAARVVQLDEAEGRKETLCARMHHENEFHHDVPLVAMP